MQDDLDPDDIAMWQIIAAAFIIVTLSTIAGFALYNVYRSVA